MVIDNGLICTWFNDEGVYERLFFCPILCRLLCKKATFLFLIKELIIFLIRHKMFL